MAGNGLFNISNKQHVLISFNALYDLDVGLIELIREQYANKDVFDFEKLYQSNFTLLFELYLRTNINPLYIIATDEANKIDLEEYYKQFMDEKFMDICQRSIYTDLIKLIDIIRTERNTIDVEIVYYDDKQKEYLEKDSKISNITKIYFKDIYKEKKEVTYKYDFVYIKSLEELPYLCKLESSLVYIARYGFNLNAERTFFDEENDALKLFIALERNNNIGVYEPYNFQILQEIKNIKPEDLEDASDDGIPFEDEFDYDDGEGEV